jgi:diacylglycerol kinase family enzyme
MGRTAHLRTRRTHYAAALVPGYLLINPRSGRGGPSAAELREEARARGVEARVLEEGDDAEAVARAAGAEALGVAGGDGSLAPIAAVALEHDLPFVCVPFGTRNHFARDLGLDRNDPVAALDAFAGAERRVDVGRVNGAVFLNNVSLGLYARLVHRREQHRRRRELLARARALGIVLTHRKPLGLRIDGQPLTARVLLVANNAYAPLELFSLGERERLDEGLLYLYVPTGLLRRPWEERPARELEVDARARVVQAAVDGEPVELELPARFTIEPAALRVLLPGG